ncbi:MAG: nuclear transport factor 2 family protein [Sphingomicrobium sp.]
MNMTILIPSAVALAMSLAACDRAAAPTETPPAGAAAAADTEAVTKIASDLIAAIEARDVAKIKAYYAPDAVMILPDRAPLRGAEVIGADYEKFATDPAGKFDATDEATVVGADMAYSHGNYTVTYTNLQTKAVENDNGYYVIVYKKQADGNWKVVQDVSSSLPKAA